MLFCLSFCVDVACHYMEQVSVCLDLNVQVAVCAQAGVKGGRSCACTASCCRRRASLRPGAPTASGGGGAGPCSCPGGRPQPPAPA